MEQDQPHSPSVLDRSSHMTAGHLQRSVFMENQLDLNESEMEYYEGVINDLADKVDALQVEKEDLQSISASLGERLQRSGQQREEDLRRAQEELASVRGSLQDKLGALQSQLSESKEVSPLSRLSVLTCVALPMLTMTLYRLPALRLRVAPLSSKKWRLSSIRKRVMCGSCDSCSQWISSKAL